MGNETAVWKYIPKTNFTDCRGETFNTDLESDWSLRRSRHLLLCLNGSISWAAKNKIKYLFIFFQSINGRKEEAMLCSTASAWSWTAMFSTHIKDLKVSPTTEHCFTEKRELVDTYEQDSVSWKLRTEFHLKNWQLQGQIALIKTRTAKENQQWILWHFCTSLFLMVYSMMTKSDQHQTTGKPLLTTFPLHRLRLEGSNHG